MQSLAQMIFSQVPFFDEYLAGFDHIPRNLKHEFLVLVRCVDRNVGIGPGPQVALVLQS